LHDREFSFVILGDQDGLINNSLGGTVVMCKPKQFHQYSFSESISAGWTDLSADEMKKVLAILASMWSDHPYHITRHNCLLFAKALVETLGLSANFPAWLIQACVTARETPGIASFIDNYWVLSKWYMDTIQTKFRSEQSTCCPTCGKAELGDTSSAVTWDSNQSIMCVNSRDHMSKWQRYQKCWNGFCGINSCDQDSYCIVHSFTQLGVGKAELYFEVVQTSNVRPGEHPRYSRLYWHGGSLLPASLRRVICVSEKQVFRKMTGSVSEKQVCRTMTGILLYEKIPNEYLESGKTLQFRYASEKYSLLSVSTSPETIEF